MLAHAKGTYKRELVNTLSPPARATGLKDTTMTNIKGHRTLSPTRLQRSGATFRYHHRSYAVPVSTVQHAATLERH